MANRQPSVASFLRRGILPDDVPPLLTSANLVQPTIGDTTAYAVTPDVVGRPSPYNGSKRGFQRRAFSIPHPVFVRDAAVFFRKHWSDLDAHLQKSKGSCSKPTFDESRTRALRITPHSRLPALRLKALARYRYCLVTDVSRCFPSIYTHSIPWALHGKEASKKDRKANSSKVFGNKIDFIVRQSQDGQTMGLPIGPDHSRVVAELIMTSVDLAYFEEQLEEGYIRHVDDFWIGGDTQSDCEDSLQSLRRALTEYSLDINELKTKILPTSSIIAENWPYELEAQLEDVLDLDASRYEGRIVSLLGSVVEYSSKSQDDGVVKFFLRRIDAWEKWDDYWDLLEPFLAHCGVQFPHSFDYVAQVLAWRVRTGRAYDKKLWAHVTRKIIASAANAGRDAEAVWGLWLAKELNIKISLQTYEALAFTNSPLVAAVGAHFVRKGKVRGKANLSDLWDRVEARAISGPSWPLALELNHLGLKPPKGLDLSGPVPLKSIFDAGASLVDWDAYPAAFIKSDDELEENPTSALRLIGFGYDDDDDEEGDPEAPF